VALMRWGETRTGFWKPEGKKRHQARPRHRWEDIKMDLQERGWAWAWWTTLIWLRTETDGKLLWT